MKIVSAEPANFPDRFRDDFPLLHVQNKRRLSLILPHPFFEMLVWRSSYSPANAVTTMRIDRRSVVTMKPGAVGTDRNQVCEWKLVIVPVFAKVCHQFPIERPTARSFTLAFPPLSHHSRASSSIQGLRGFHEVSSSAARSLPSYPSTPEPSQPGRARRSLRSRVGR